MPDCFPKEVSFARISKTQFVDYSNIHWTAAGKFEEEFLFIRDNLQVATRLPN